MQHLRHPPLVAAVREALALRGPLLLGGCAWLDVLIHGKQIPRVVF